VGILPWLRLMRLPNVFTALADIAMGYFLAAGGLRSAAALACLAAASALLYTAGMVLNDVFDYAIDAEERPFRPLPSGQIALVTARRLGFALLIGGWLFGGAAGFLPGAADSWRSGLVATALAAAVLAYDGFLKATPAGPLGMGACRFLNVLLGASTAPAADASLGFAPAVWLAAAGIGIYIVGVTWLARREAGASRPGALAGATGVMLLGVGVLWIAYRLHTTTVASPRMEPWLFAVLLALLMFSVVRRCAAAMRQPAPQNVQAAVKHSILSLIWLDAATVAAAAGPIYGVAVAALLLPALALGRWVYST